MDQSFKDLLEASSLGTPAARRIRSSTPSEVVDDVRRRMEHRREPSLRDAAASGRQPTLLRRSRDRAVRGRQISARIAIRSLVTEQARTGGWLAAYQDVQAQKADRLRAQHAGLRARAGYRDGDLAAHPGSGQETVADLRRDQTGQRAQIDDDMTRGSRKHHRLPRWICRLPKLVLLFDFCLLLYFFAGITGVDWASPLSANLAFAVPLAAIVTTLSYGFLGFAGYRLRRYKDHSGMVATSDLDGITRTACGAAAAGMTVVAALIFIRMRTEVLYALGPQGRVTALMIALVLAMGSLLANFLVVAIHALDGSAETARLEALGAAMCGPLALQHRLREQAAVFDQPIASIGREAERAAAAAAAGTAAAVYELAAADQIIDAARAVHQGADPPSEPAINPNGEDGVVGYRGIGGKPEVDEHGTRRASRSNRRGGSGRLTGAVALAAVAVIAIVVAVAATSFGLRFSSVSSQGTGLVIAATATANEPAPALSADILQTLRSAGDSSTGATTYVVSPGDGRPAVLPLTPRSADGQIDYGPTRTAALATNISAVERALGNEGANGQLDLLGTIAAAIRATSSPATLIVVSSGLSTAGGFDLRQVGWDADPGSLAAQLKARGLLPALAGWRVVFSGLGDVAGRQPALPLPQQTTLASYWMAICQASGAASCSVDTTARPQLASHITNLVPVVPVPVVASIRGPGETTITTMPDTLLFSPGSSTLIPSADTILQLIAQRARNQHQLVSITGYASPDGGTIAYNLALSARRANAVRDRLIALGLPAGQINKVTGAGTAGQNPAVCLVHGHLDVAICAQLRRVVVVLSPAKNS